MNCHPERSEGSVVLRKMQIGCSDPDPFSATRDGLPLARLHQFFDLAFDEVTLQRADVGDIEFSIQMICLMQQGARQQVFSRVLEELAVDILRAYGYGFGARDPFAKIRDAQAAFASTLPSFFTDNLGVNQDKLCARVFLESHIHNGDSFRNANLRRSQTDAASG